MKMFNKYVGLDVHKDTTVIAVAEGQRDGGVRIYGTISSDLHALEKTLRKFGGELKKQGQALGIGVDAIKKTGSGLGDWG